MAGWHQKTVGETEDSVLYDLIMEGWNQTTVDEAEDSVLFAGHMEGRNQNTSVEHNVLYAPTLGSAHEELTAVLQRKYAGNPASERMIVLEAVRN